LKPGAWPDDAFKKVRKASRKEREDSQIKRYSLSQSDEVGKVIRESAGGVTNLSLAPRAQGTIKSALYQIRKEITKTLTWGALGKLEQVGCGEGDPIKRGFEQAGACKIKQTFQSWGGIYQALACWKAGADRKRGKGGASNDGPWRENE